MVSENDKSYWHFDDPWMPGNRFGPGTPVLSKCINVDKVSDSYISMIESIFVFYLGITLINHPMNNTNEMDVMTYV